MIRQTSEQANSVERRSSAARIDGEGRTGEPTERSAVRRSTLSEDVKAVYGHPRDRSGIQPSRAFAYDHTNPTRSPYSL